MIGALKVAAMPAAAPEAGQTRLKSASTRSSCPTEDPTADYFLAIEKSDGGVNFIGIWG